MTDQKNKATEASQSDPVQATGNRVISRTTPISAIVVLAAIALIIILMPK